MDERWEGEIVFRLGVVTQREKGLGQ